MGLEKIALAKKQMGITTEELSNLSGIPIGTLNKILSGATKDPKLETLKAIARVLGLTLDDFDDKTNERNESLKPTQADLKNLIARNGKQMSDADKLELIKLLSEL